MKIHANPEVNITGGRQVVLRRERRHSVVLILEWNQSCIEEKVPR